MSRAYVKQLALAAAVIGLCVGGFFACFERREIEVFSAESAEARRNRHLALARLLREMGHAVEVREDLEAVFRLPEPPASVFLTSSRATLGRTHADALLRWVERGGQLVVVTYTVWEPDGKGVEQVVSGRPDLLLDRFGLKQRELDVPAEEPDAAPESVADTQAEGDETAEAQGTGEPDAAEVPEVSVTALTPMRFEIAEARLEEDQPPLELQFAERFHWDDPQGAAVWSVSGVVGTHLVEVAHGAGRISALTSDELLVNDTIGAHDHAEFVVRWLRHGREARVPVWIFVNESYPSFFALLWRHGSAALVAGGALLALWLWRSLPRFGPALPALAPARRRWLEHLEAAGRFHWRQDRGAALLAALRTGFADELARKRPAWTRLAERERVDKLAHASGLPVAEVTTALFDSGRTPKAFTAAVQALERIRAVL